VVIAENVVLRDDDPRLPEFQSRGWRIVARSWAAQLNAVDVDTERLTALIEGMRGERVVRELEISDKAAILTLDAATLADYPGGIATLHDALSPEQATVSSTRRGFGVTGPDGGLVAMTFVDINGTKVETDFTVVARKWRRQGLATAVKAASVLALLSEHAESFRTGGSDENIASLAANTSVGYTLDEVWSTLTPPAP
jgi:hypothetical protein